jgi:hypothetical protein
MTLPETEVLTSLVARVFRIEDVTAGDPEKGMQWRYRGHLLNIDSVSAFDQLAASVKPYGLTPLFRLEKESRSSIWSTLRRNKNLPTPGSM